MGLAKRTAHQFRHTFILLKRGIQNKLGIGVISVVGLAWLEIMKRDRCIYKGRRRSSREVEKIDEVGSKGEVGSM